MAGTGKAHLRNSADTVLRVEDLVVEYSAAGGEKVQAVSGVSLDIIAGETLSVVGESGCGKSTLAKGILQLIHTRSGSVVINGKDITKLKGNELREARPNMQMIFQDSISSLDPHMKVSALVEQPLKVWNRGTEAERKAKVNDLLQSVGLDPEIVSDRKPTEFSGGQCQRNGLSLLFISHDLSVVRTISDRIVVMYLGKVCEVATPDTLSERPRHHYTHALVSSVPIPDPTKKNRRAILQGEPPSPTNPPSGCRFRTRCPAATELCATEEPQLREMGGGDFVACHHPRT